MRIFHITVNMRNFDIIIIAAANLCGAGLSSHHDEGVLLFPQHTMHVLLNVCTTQIGSESEHKKAVVCVVCGQSVWDLCREVGIGAWSALGRPD